ncbi:MAG: lamin tail domain-containing protein [Myxococcota bacterium]
MRNVSLPVISSFTLPGSVNAAGDVATARWTTMNASSVQLRLKNGATAAVITTPAQVASGTFDLRPLTTATFVLEAYNQAGDVVTSEKTVTVPGGAVSVTPTPALRDDTVTLQWALSTLNVLEVVGLAGSAPSAVAASPNFVDLTTVTSAQELFFADVADGAARIPAPAGFRFPSLGTVVPELWASVNGFISYSRPAAAFSANVDLTASTTTPTLLAPFWDDLVLGQNSKVLWALQTSLITGERSLVVQWDKVQLAGDTNSELTFQVQLFETGQVSFIYKTLTGALNGATVGVVERAAGVTQQHVFNGAPMSNAIAPDLELVFFSGGPADGMQSFTARASKRIEFFARTASSVLPVSAELRVFGPGDVSVTEAMPVPEASALNGQWVELRNNASIAVDFEGLLVASTSSSVDGGFVIPAGTVVPAGGYLVLGQSTNMADNGGAPVDLMYSDVPLVVPERVTVSLQGVTLGALAWDAGVSGTSVQRVDNVLYASSTTPSCNRTRTFGPNGAFGTPGADNESCAPYRMEPIAGGYIDLSANGGTIILGSESDYTGTGTLPLARPFTFFGQTYNSVNVSMVGFLTFGPALTSAFNTTNDTTPSTGEPNGVIAPFWDEIVRNTNGEIYMLTRPDRTIISWQDFRIYATTSSAYFQVHLLDSGVIELHYGAMSTTTTTQSTLDRLAGSSATAWIEAPDGSLAIPWSINTTGGIQPNSGVRFTPVP